MAGVVNSFIRSPVNSLIFSDKEEMRSEGKKVSKPPVPGSAGVSLNTVRVSSGFENG